jgi:hypothetical protein
VLLAVDPVLSLTEAERKREKGRLHCMAKEREGEGFFSGKACKTYGAFVLGILLIFSPPLILSTARGTGEGKEKRRIAFVRAGAGQRERLWRFSEGADAA